MNNPSKLELEFRKDMLEIYRNAKEKCAYNATRFLQMVSTNGGLKTAHVLLSTNDPSDGFSRLWECGRLDLNVEYLVLDPKYLLHFSNEEIFVAKSRLNDYGFSRS